MSESSLMTTQSTKEKSIQQQLEETGNQIFDKPESVSDYVVTGSALIFIALVIGQILKWLKR